jgi:hypothetical protein
MLLKRGHEGTTSDGECGGSEGGRSEGIWHDDNKSQDIDYGKHGDGSRNPRRMFPHSSNA